VIQVLLVLLEQTEQLDHKDPQEQLVPLAQMALLDHKAFKEIQEQLALPVQLVQTEQMEQLDPQEQQVQLGPQEQQVLKAIVLDYNMNFLPAPVVEIQAQAY
jgi:hypothetical protein